MLKKNLYLKNNIYPRSLENINAILNFYFKDYPISQLEDCATLFHNDRKLSLDQIESYAYTVSESKMFFEEVFKTPSTMHNLIDYVHQVIELPEGQWQGSVSGRLKILKEYKGYLIASGLI
jgi:type I site-specific restriction-modification system R (restriction) subunit